MLWTPSVHQLSLSFLSFPSALPPLFLSPASPLTAVVVPDGGHEKGCLGEDMGSEEDLLYEDFRGSAHRFGHPGGGGGEQLAINEVSRSPIQKFANAIAELLLLGGGKTTQNLYPNGASVRGGVTVSCFVAEVFVRTLREPHLRVAIWRFQKTIH